MKRITAILFVAILITSCTDSAVDGIETADQNSMIEAQSTVSADTKDRCRAFRPNYILGTKRNYQLEVLESSSDFVNHIYLIQGSTATFLATDDDTGTVISLPPTSPGSELIFEIRVFDPAGNFTGDVWQSGDASRNADGAVHALVDRCNKNRYIVRFEDIPASGWGAPDEPNYVDAIFRLF